MGEDRLTDVSRKGRELQSGAEKRVGKTGFRRGEGGDEESRFLEFRHVLGQPRLLLYPHPAGHFP